jgi:ABC-type sugar transport system ATPase subunit
VGVPWEIYKNPANLFVATFVGKINAIDAKLGESLGEGMRKATAGSTVFAVPSAGTEDCVDAVLAFRPEDVVETTAEASGTNRLDGKLKTTSFLGTVASLEIDLKGQDIVIERHRPKKADIPNVGDVVEFAVPPDACLLFDKKTGRRLSKGAKP